MKFTIDSLVKSQNFDGKEKSSSSRRANLEEYRASGSRKACVVVLLTPSAAAALRCTVLTRNDTKCSVFQADRRNRQREPQHRNWTFYEAITIQAALLL